MGEKAEGQTAPGGGRRGPCGILLIDKPSGPTSHDIVAWVRWALRERSVGHCGTLDPAASGLLVLCLGAATKLVRYLQGVDKVYRASFVLGLATTTADADGEVVERAAVDAGVMTRADRALREMVGRLMLVPPAFSAIRLGGRRAHEIARAGESVELASREMALFGVDDVAVAGSALTATLTVSKGTYVRSLAEELGRRVHMPAHLGSLRRLACGHLALDHPRALGGLAARTLPAAREGAVRWRIRPRGGPEDGPTIRGLCSSMIGQALVSPVEALPFPVVLAEDGPQGEEALARLGHGQRLDIDHPGLRDSEVIGPLETRVGVCGPRGQLLVARVERSGAQAIELRPERMVIAPGATA
jgi:tRNA pseudouridine55 synthase